MYQIVGLETCAPLACRPRFIPKARPRGLKAVGIAYERKVGVLLRKIFRSVESGRWFEFVDCGQTRCCQVDHFVNLPNQVLLIECKLSEKDHAWEQMRNLYAPILMSLYGKPVTRVQATKILRSGKRPILDLREALLWPGGEFLWHFLG